jgi:Zn-finger nucleic acid-binding protein
MKCPACDHELREKEVGGVVVDVCEGGCGGIWFDNFELKKFDEPNEAAGEELLDIPRDPNVVVDFSVRRECPVCDGIVMMQHPFSPNDDVIVDECPGCGGIWLDAGELAGIRQRFATEAERAEAARASVGGLIARQLAMAREESRKSDEKVDQIAGIFKFLCPSYWIPGKQEGAAY